MSDIIRLNETAPNEDEVNTSIVLPWLERFALLIDQMTAENWDLPSRCN